jgi:hypothetical protein
MFLRRRRTGLDGEGELNEEACRGAGPAFFLTDKRKRRVPHPFRVLCGKGGKRKPQPGAANLQTLAQFAGKFTQRGLIAPVPHPLAQFLGLYQSRFLQNGHMMGDRRLGEVNALLDIGGA